MHLNSAFACIFLFCTIIFSSKLIAQNRDSSICDPFPIFTEDTLVLCPQEPIRLPKRLINDSIFITWVFNGDSIGGKNFVPKLSGAYTFKAHSARCGVISEEFIKIKSIPELKFKVNNVCLGKAIQLNHKVLLPNSQDSLIWRFGNGASLSTKDTVVNYVYSTADTYQVSLHMLSQGCRDTSTLSVVIYANPQVSFAGLKDRYCLGEAGTALVGSPLGGSFTGPNVVNVQNTPGVANFIVGNQPHQPFYIYYTFVDQNGCRGVDSLFVAGIFRPTTLSLSPLNRTYCQDHGVVSVDLFPAGGVLSGNGFTANTERSKAFFDPSQQNGDAFLIYTYVDTNSCVSVIRDTTTSIPIPRVSITDIKSIFCLNEHEVSLIGSPAGGIFSGPNVFSNPAGAVFRPIQIGQNIPIIYSYTNINGCKGADTIVVKNVFSRPQVSASTLATRYCSDQSPVEVILSPAGGTLTGNGFALNSEKNKATFNPATPGTYVLRYSYTDANGCSAEVSDTTTSFSAPIVNIASIPTKYCVGAAEVSVNASPIGGLFSGNNITNTTSGKAVFRPIAVEKNNRIIYAYTDANGCKGADTIVITDVFERPKITLSSLAPKYCVDHPLVEVTLTPGGGNIGGNGFTINPEKNKATYNPRSPGRAILLYTYTDINGCSATASDTTISYELPIVRLNDISPNYCIGDPDVVLSATPSGGVFTGSNVIGNSNGTGIYKPIRVEQNNIIAYTYTNQNGCTAADSFLVKEVFKLPEVTLSGLNPDYCANSPKDTLIGLPVGGTFSGDPLTLNGNQGIFISRTPKKYNFTYSYRDVNGCRNSASFQTEVFAIPKIDLGPDTSLVSGRTLVLNPTPENNPALKYQWSTGATTPSITVRNPGFYLVKVTLSACIVMDTIFIEVRAVSAKDIDILSTAKIYPNPSNSLLKVELKPVQHLPKSRLMLYNLDGKLLYSKSMDRISAGQLHTETIDVKLFKTGLYLIYVDAIPLGKVMINP